MWIKKIPNELAESSRSKANFLFNKGKIYVMDNHLCAAWCWLQKIQLDRKYDFIHIDRHNDLLLPSPTINKDILDNNIDLQSLTFDEYLELYENHPEEPNMKIKLFRWDNYILNINELYPQLFGSKYFITKESYPDSDFIDIELRIEDFVSDSHWFDNSENSWIVNLDLDFLFSNSKGIYQLYSNQLVQKIGEILKQNLNNFAVLTIALSPECCGNWENSFRIMRILDEILELNMRL
ncbi:UPF0489 family protein [Elizabethkingia anophelis]|uniref:UPF0489 family protein n=2 Tax=Elizabethkingia anophelis TaxID=1117645 RepID=UPI0016264295|nr:UPF0489 family protein [Elizabethkingia anophelis]MCT4014686.1 hypothetical protein [Elizabethkingia anophelis]CAH1150071.1 hypothetical protein EAVVTKC53_03122 [Elizabethkingia anophelis]CAI9678619.1 hypothetical protein EAVVTKC53_00721 [Elizabethkingia anophelis]